jgi:hypothetical protein
VHSITAVQWIRRSKLFIERDHEFCKKVWPSTMTTWHHRQPSRPNSGSVVLLGDDAAVHTQAQIHNLWILSLWETQATIAAIVSVWQCHCRVVTT